MTGFFDSHKPSVWHHFQYWLDVGAWIEIRRFLTINLQNGSIVIDRNVFFWILLVVPHGFEYGHQVEPV